MPAFPSHLVAALLTILGLILGLSAAGSSQPAFSFSGKEHAAVQLDYVDPRSGYTPVTDPQQVRAILAQGLKARGGYTLSIQGQLAGSSPAGSLSLKVDFNSGSIRVDRIDESGRLILDRGSLRMTKVAPQDPRTAQAALSLLQSPLVIWKSTATTAASQPVYVITGGDTSRGVVMVAL